MSFTAEDLRRIQEHKKSHGAGATFKPVSITERPRREPEGTLMKALDKITRPLYASAGFSNALIQGKSTLQALTAAKKGITGEERIFYSDVLKTAGVKNKYVRAIGGFALDVGLDPITYLTFGVGAGAKMGLTTLNKTGLTFLNRTLTKQLPKLTKMNLAAGITEQTAGQMARETVEAGVLRVALKSPEKYIAESTIRMLGKKIPIVSDAWKYGAKKTAGMIDKVPGTNWVREKPMRWVGEHFIGDAYKIKHAKGITPLEKNLQALFLQQEKTRAVLGSERAIQGAIKMAREVPKTADRELIANMIEQSMKKKTELSTLLPEHLTKHAEKLKKFILKEIKEPEVQRGLLKDFRKGEIVIPHYYKQKLSKLWGEMPHPIVARNRHGRVRIFETMEEAIEKGWQPIEDYAVSVGLRNAYSKRIIAVDDYVQKTLSNVGTPISKKSAMWKSMVESKRVPKGMGLYMPRGGARFAPLHNSGKAKMVQIRNMNAMKRLSRLEGKQGIEGKTGFFGEKLLEDLRLTPVEKAFVISDDIPVYLMPKEIADMMNTASPYLTTDKGIKEAFNFYDQALNLWKTSVTVWFPGFHARNAMSNAWLCFLGGLKNPQRVAEATRIQRYDSAISRGKSVKDFTIRLHGKAYKASELTKMGKESGVLNRGWFGAEVGETIEHRIMSQAGIKPKVTGVVEQTKRIAGTATNVGRRVGNAVENNARFSLFLDQINKGIDVGSAARHTKKFLFDYGELTQWEKQVMKRVIPFYTWMRKNIPLEVEQMLKQPGKFSMANKVKEAVESLSKRPDEKYLPDWMREKEMYVRLPYESPDKPLYMNPDFAFQDLAKLSSNPAVLREWMASLSPAIKFPFEVMANYNFFFGREIVDEDLPEMKKFLLKSKEALLNNLRITGFATKLTRKDLGFLEKVLDSLLGLKAFPYDEAKSKYWHYQRKEREQRALRKYESKK